MLSVVALLPHIKSRCRYIYIGYKTFLGHIIEWTHALEISIIRYVI